MFRQVFLVIFASLVLSEIATAGVVRIPDLDVPATGIPVSFVTEHEWLPTDSLVLSAEGITCTLAGCELRLNAAGIVAFNSFAPDEVGDPEPQVYDYEEGAHQGALILSNQPFLDGDRPWIQLIRPSVGNGLGADTVPSIVHSSRSLGDYGGFLAEPVAAGTTLYLSTADFNHSDNSLSYRVTSIPEPRTVFIAMFATLAIAVRGRNRLSV